MARGKYYWEMTFDPDGKEPNAQKCIDKFDNASGFEYAELVLTPSYLKARINLRDKHFSFCDCKGDLEKASFTNCTFKQCKFIGAHCTKVKFTNCAFEMCHFIHTDFDNCRFIGCKFESISVAAEHFNVISTVISASDFLGAVTTNVKHLPDSTTSEYQKSRLKRDKAKLAQILYRSNPEVFGRHFFAAHKELILCSIIADIEAERFLESPEGKPKGSTPQHRGKFSFLHRTSVSYIELGAVYLAGTLTDWGQSIAKALFFIIAVIACFGLLYETCFGMSFLHGLLRSVDVSLVAGYTAHIDPADSKWLKTTTLLNLVFGLYWYSLIVPVVTRKFLR